MEAECVKRIFEHAIKKHKSRYVQFLGDGDTKSYINVKDTQPGIEIEKLECVGHYQKRIGTRLRNLKQKEKELGDRGCLSDATIDRLHNYVGVAIRQNVEDLKSMKSSFSVSLFHVGCNKDNSYHYPHCPIVPNSWCKYSADRANKTETYKPGQSLPRDIIYKIIPIFLGLSKYSELEKCLHGKTQNANESFNTTMWERIPKTTFVTLLNLEFGKASVLVYENVYTC